MPFESSHLLEIKLRKLDKQVIMGVPDAIERISLQAENGIAYSGIDDEGNVVVIGGVALLWEGVGSGWVITSELFVNHKIWCHRAIRNVLIKAESQYNLHRIESLILKDHKISMKWAERLGFSKEGLLRKYDSSKNDYYLFARVK